MATGALAETVVEEVATNLEEVAQATRKINTLAVRYFGVGMGAGFLVGFYWGRKWNREKIQAEVLKEAEEQIDKIREYYQQKVARETKPGLDEIVEERGYATDRSEEPVGTRTLRPPVPIMTPPMRFTPPAEPVSEDPDWIWPQELASRSPEQPYIIHEDEYRTNENNYEQTQYTYWATDDVLTDTDESPVPHPELVVGRENLRFGHGAGDPNIVFIRNDRLELEIEIARDPRSYEEEKLGHTRPDEDGITHSSQTRPARKRKRNP